MSKDKNLSTIIGCGLFAFAWKTLVRLPIALALMYNILAALGDAIPSYVWVLFYVSIPLGFIEIVLHSTLNAALEASKGE